MFAWLFLLVPLVWGVWCYNRLVRDSHRVLTAWSDVEVPMRGADYRTSLAEFYLDNEEERLLRLQEYIDYTLMVDKEVAAGMKQDPEFFRRTAEYRKTHLINVHRSTLINSWQPSDDELMTVFFDNMDMISVPEARKVQMVVVASKEEAHHDVFATLGERDDSLLSLREELIADILPTALSEDL